MFVIKIQQKSQTKVDAPAWLSLVLLLFVVVVVMMMMMMTMCCKHLGRASLLAAALLESNLLSPSETVLKTHNPYTSIRVRDGKASLKSNVRPKASQIAALLH